MDRPTISLCAPAAAADTKGWREVAADLARSGNPEVAQIGTVLCAIGAEVAGGTVTAAEVGKDRLTYKEFAKRVGYSLRTVKGWAARKIITVEKIGGGVRIHYPTADAELKARGIKSKAVTSVTAIRRAA